MMPPSRAVMLCGTEEVDPPPRLLRAGALSVEFENGGLRYVRFAGIEVLRAIAFLVRDENWGTFAAQISDLQIAEEAARFTVSYRAVCSDAQRCLTYQAAIVGTADGSLAFEVNAECQTDFLTNRTGFVVLHPCALAGREVHVTHVDGRRVTARFPELISPGQPLFEIRALEHEITPGVRAICHMDGDGFEMEDQRNWGDASFKTYVGSLLKPWPYRLAKGSRLAQSVRVSISGRENAPAPARRDAAEPVAVDVAGETGSQLPAFGVGLPAIEAQPTLAVLDLLSRLGPHFLVCQVDLREDLRLSMLDAYRQVGEATGAELELEVVIPDESDAAAELGRLAAGLAEVGLEAAGIAVSTAADLLSWQPGQERPTRPTTETICAAARTAFPSARLGGGMFAYFTELNRKRPLMPLFDHLSHTTCPIVHAADDRSVMESLETLPAMIASTRAFSGGRPYRVGPSAIGCRQNPYGQAPFDNPQNRRVCLARVDPRQRGLFGAAFVLGYAAACARGRVEAVALGAPTGPFGFIHHGSASWPFDTLAEPAVYPAFHVLASLTRGSGRPLLATGVSLPGVVDVLAWREGKLSVILLGNLTGQPVRVTLSGLSATTLRVAVIDAAHFDVATRDPSALDALTASVRTEPILLDAYAVARIEARSPPPSSFQSKARP